MLPLPSVTSICVSEVLVGIERIRKDPLISRYDVGLAVLIPTKPLELSVVNRVVVPVRKDVFVPEEPELNVPSSEVI